MREKCNPPNFQTEPTFTGESLDQMLKMFSLSAPIQYKLIKRNKLNDDAYEKQIIKLTTKP